MDGLVEKVVNFDWARAVTEAAMVKRVTSFHVGQPSGEQNSRPHSAGAYNPPFPHRQYVAYPPRRRLIRRRRQPRQRKARHIAHIFATATFL